MSDQVGSPDDRRPPSERVVEAVAAASGTSPLDFEPTLYDAVDPEALDSLVRSGSDELRIRFRYGDRSVLITGNGRVDVSAPSEDDPSSEWIIFDE
ncbi:hypothetical protein HTZ84_11445 [Haloterrigena sp. SYSU A558-1]|uniref:Halobacterial output domain-containing protein n=1 Tax=Haloterrigena gelatinilytica TaxID=2741724 RepID=A0A8J8GMZ0_9EURY|nr:HalOD1 output domain-containing protein [Haloterrigena gelatinilytica]NUB91344.1 hypothetical protein [Haloterrigena gelatinilytica]NUC72917.1 hypothetical protein [Haloterrigena gelatinilytica]